MAKSKGNAVSPAEASLVQPTNKATRLLDLIRQGGQTADSLMAAIDVNKAGLASQLSYLNTRGLNIAEIDPTRAEFPMKGEDGVYFLASAAAYAEKQRMSSGFGAGKPLTPNEAIEKAQKREDKASAHVTKLEAREAMTEIDQLKLSIAREELRLASLMLSAVENGDYSHESFKVV